ncbi:MAG TPA: cbb3-type cytochrome c oxidase subunit II [Planctomycetota bacterium]|nr:cbb3-type cytochrome c oxidase subunit II [Planctomycetota bacterium]
MDRLKPVLLVGGLGCFALSFVLSGVYPWLITDARRKEASFEEITRDVSPDFKALKEAYPAEFVAAFATGRDALTDEEVAARAPDAATLEKSDAAWRAAYADAVRRGRDRYVAEACFHCHSQYVRPVANEEIRFGPVRRAEDDNNAAQRPVLWGTRRVGPDLTYEGGLRSNDWHVAHFADPQSVSPDSIMPRYSWYLKKGWQVKRRIDPAVARRNRLDPETSYGYAGVYSTQADAEAALKRVAETLPEALVAEKGRLFVAETHAPTADGLALISYLQWLGTWTAPTEP